MSPFNADRSGFVLLEAVVALLVLALVGSAALSVAGGGLRVSGRGARLLEARALADDRLAALRLLSHDDLQDLPDSLETGRFEPPFDAYHWTARSGEVRDEPALFDVAVEITWDGGAWQLDSRVYRPGPIVREAP